MFSSGKFTYALPILWILSACSASGPGQTASSSTISGEYCAGSSTVSTPSGSTGSANVFLVDPATDSGDAALSPASAVIGSLAHSVTLEHLLGDGKLSGAYVKVVSGLCGSEAGAFHELNQFLYDYGDPRFGEGMDYYHGDQYRSRLDDASALLPTDPVTVITSCSYDDNAFYTQDYDNSGNLVDMVCMGKSSRYSSGLFSHDGQVSTHELQHAMTTHAYSPTYDLNRLDYDDAGSLNEGISDFVALMMTEENVPAGFEVTVFSRWGLGALLPNLARGATKCPVYDSSYPTCDAFQAGTGGFSAGSNHVSFTYPDGLGWPMARSRSGPGFVRSHFVANRSIEEIHQNGIIVSGALWDAYVNLKALLPRLDAQKQMLKLIAEALATLPKPTVSNLSPVTYPGFGAALVSTANILGWSASEKAALQSSLDQRGLTSTPQVQSGWASVGTGRAAITPGLHVIDIPPTSAQQANGKLNRGEKAAVFFDIRNTDVNTAGSLLLDVTVDSTRIQFLGSDQNYGYLSPSHAMIRYGKVNGTAIVSALSSASATYHVPTGNTYFLTNPKYADTQTMTTPLYVQIPAGATTGTANFTVRIVPANGTTETLTFPVEILP